MSSMLTPSPCTCACSRERTSNGHLAAARLALLAARIGAASDPSSEIAGCAATELSVHDRDPVCIIAAVGLHRIPANELWWPAKGRSGWAAIRSPSALRADRRPDEARAESHPRRRETRPSPPSEIGKAAAPDFPFRSSPRPRRTVSNSPRSRERKSTFRAVVLVSGYAPM